MSPQPDLHETWKPPPSRDLQLLPTDQKPPIVFGQITAVSKGHNDDIWVFHRGDVVWNLSSFDSREDGVHIANPTAFVKGPAVVQLNQVGAWTACTPLHSRLTAQSATHCMHSTACTAAQTAQQACSMQCKAPHAKFSMHSHLDCTAGSQHGFDSITCTARHAQHAHSGACATVHHQSLIVRESDKNSVLCMLLHLKAISTQLPEHSSSQQSHGCYQPC